jgi:hypothetical protein
MTKELEKLHKFSLSYNIARLPAPTQLRRDAVVRKISMT